MTRRESAIVGAYTGILCGPFDAMHEYIEEILGRPVLTHELASKELCKEVKALAMDEFIAMGKAVK